MNTLTTAGPRRAGLRTRSTRTLTGAAGVGLLLGVLAACSPGATGVPTVPAASGGILPSIDVSPIASAASQAALAALDQLQTLVTSNATASGVPSDAVGSLTQAITALKTAIQTGDTTQIQSALTDLTTKADAMSSQLGGDAGTQLKSALDALKAALPTS